MESATPTRPCAQLAVLRREARGTSHTSPFDWGSPFALDQSCLWEVPKLLCIIAPTFAQIAFVQCQTFARHAQIAHFAIGIRPHFSKKALVFVSQSRWMALISPTLGWLGESSCRPMLWASKMLENSTLGFELPIFFKC